MSTTNKRGFWKTIGIPVPRNSREVRTFLPGTDIREVSDLIPTAAITATWPIKGTAFSELDFTNDYDPDANGDADTFNSYQLYKMKEENGKPWFTRLYFVPSYATPIATASAGADVINTNYIVDDEEGLRETVTITTKDGNGNPGAPTGAVIQQNQTDDPGMISVLSSNVITAAVPRTDYETESRSQSLITITKEYLNALTAPTPAIGSEVTQKQVRGDWVHRITKTVNNTSLLAYKKTFPSSLHIGALGIPPTLVSASIVWAEGYAEGDSDTDWTGSYTGYTSVSGGDSNSAEGSGSYIPEVIPVIKPPPEGIVDTTLYAFYLPLSACTLSDILAKIGGGCARWPIFKPTIHVISLIGCKVSVQARASASASLSRGPASDSDSLTEGEGSSYDISYSHNTKVIGPCINAAVTVSGTATKTQNISVTAVVGWTGNGDFPTVSVSKNAAKAVNASVSPTSLSATTVTAAPSSGLYLVGKPEVSLATGVLAGYVFVIAEVMDAAQLA